MLKSLPPTISTARAVAPGFAVLVLHAILGNALGHEPIVDPIAHFLGGSAVAYCVVELTPRMKSLFGDPSRFATILLAIGIGTLAALGWELAELGSDLLFGTTIQLDARNTLRDLALGLFGAIAIAVTCARGRQTSK